MYLLVPINNNNSQHCSNQSRFDTMLDLILERVPSFMADQRHPRGARGLFSDHLTYAVVGMRACIYKFPFLHSLFFVLYKRED